VAHGRHLPGSGGEAPDLPFSEARRRRRQWRASRFQIRPTRRDLTERHQTLARRDEPGYRLPQVSGRDGFLSDAQLGTRHSEAIDNLRDRERPPFPRARPSTARNAAPALARPRAIPEPPGAHKIRRSAIGGFSPRQARRTKLASSTPASQDSREKGLRRFGAQASSSASISKPKECAADPIGSAVSANCNRSKRVCKLRFIITGGRSRCRNPCERMITFGSHEDEQL